uniref:Interleukin-17A-like n=1 Tax=Myripristis murdjan TaxID=586833 RepID=A0A668A109_9TELE
QALDICPLIGPVLCSALWVLSWARERAPPLSSGCDSMMSFSPPPVSSSSEGNGNIHVRSLSPWTWKPSTVKNRIPSTIWEAECSSAHCSGLAPGQPDEPGLNAVPIQQSVLVLSRRPSGCYIASYLTVSVGCTCVWARTAQSAESGTQSPPPTQQ